MHQDKHRKIEIYWNIWDMTKNGVKQELASQPIELSQVGTMSGQANSVSQPDRVDSAWPNHYLVQVREEVEL